MNKVLGAYFGNQLRVSCQNGLGSSIYNLYDLKRNNSNKNNCSIMTTHFLQFVSLLTRKNRTKQFSKQRYSI